ncbi:MAG: hypothetical protein EA398_11680 [Deltaproteobacteria bacterium]|nr:MAG: hypothetical protein EA398_11680 [Deltaproteobacteria bacterium]
MDPPPCPGCALTIAANATHPLQATPARSFSDRAPCRTPSSGFHGPGDHPRTTPRNRPRARASTSMSHEASTDDVTGTIAGHLEALADIGEHKGMHTLVREIREERLPILREGRMSMVVLGEFNHGKSSVINALLGRDMLPTGITPTTSVITHIRQGEGPARVVRDGGTDEVEGNALRDVIIHDPPDDLRFVELRAPSPFLEHGLFIVDTPGVNDISQQKVEITYGYVPRADVIVYVLDANQALKRSEISFIRDRLLKDSHERIFFVLGKVDGLKEGELDEIRAHIEGRLTPILGEIRLYPLSARRALEDGHDEGFERFRDDLRAFITAQRETILIESAARAGLRIASLIDTNLAIERSALRLDADELARRIDSVRGRLSQSRMMVADNVALIDRRITEIRATTRDAIRDFATAFTEALPREIERAGADDVKRYLPDFIHDTFKEFVEGEGTATAMRLEQVAEEIISITNRNMREAMAEAQKELGVESRDLNLDVNTFGYDVGVFALGALGVTFLAFSNLLVGGLLTLSAPVLAFVLKDRVDARIRAQATEQAVQAVRAAALKVEEELVHQIDEFGDRLREFVEGAGDRLYRQISESLDHLAGARRGHEEDTGPLAAELDDTRKQVLHHLVRLRAIRDRTMAAQGENATGEVHATEPPTGTRPADAPEGAPA